MEQTEVQGIQGPVGPTGPQGPSGADLFDHPWMQFGTNVYYTGGNVGIGTTAPTHFLDIRKNHDADTSILINNDQATPNARAYLRILTVKDGGDPTIELGQGSGGPEWGLGVDNSDGDKFMISGGTTTAPFDVSTDPRLTIDTSGNVGIGTTSPLRKLHVDGQSFFAGNMVISPPPSDIYLHFHDNQVNGRKWWVGTEGSAGGRFIIYDKTIGQYRLAIDASGNVGIGTTTPGYKLHVNGTAYATGAAGSLSDIRHKKNVQPVTDGALDIIEKLRPITYEWKAPADSGMEGTQIGLIAQEVEKVLPEVVLTQDDEDQTKALKYNEFIPVIIKAIQEVKRENDTLRTENGQLLEKLASLADRQDTIEEMLLALSTNLPMEKLVKNNQVGLEGVQNNIQ